MRDSDAQALHEKGAETLQLKEELQRLTGEVEVLRGDVEEGLKERCSARDIHIEGSAADLGMSQDLEEEEDNDNEDELELEEEELANNEHERSQGQGVDGREYQDGEEVEKEDELARFDPNSAPLRAADCTLTSPPSANLRTLLR